MKFQFETGSGGGVGGVRRLGKIWKRLVNDGLREFVS